MKVRTKVRLDIPKPPYPDGVGESLDKWLAGAPLQMPEIFEAFHVHPDLAARAGVLGAGFLGHCLISPRDREIIIDRITGMYGAVHEWGLHATAFGKGVGLSNEQLDSTAVGPDRAGDLWSADELALISVVEELAETTDLGEQSWAFLRNRYDDKQVVEFIVLVGWYRTVSSMCNTLRIPPHPQCRRFPNSVPTSDESPAN